MPIYFTNFVADIVQVQFLRHLCGILDTVSSNMEHNVRSTMNISNNCMIAFTGPYKPHTGRTNQCMNHAPAILAPLAIIYGTHRCQLHGLLLPIFTGNAVSLYRVRCLSSSTADAADGHGACFSLRFWTV